MRRRAWLRLAALGALSLGRGPGVSAATMPLVAAHRGGALLWPENSSTAFRNALALNVDLLETDVHLTSDGEVVIVHDPTLDRTTTGQGPVSSISKTALASVRLKGLDGAPTADGVPTLASLLELMTPWRAGLLLEIKVDADRRRYPGIEEKVLEQVKARGLLDRTPIMGFQPETIRRVRELEPRAQTVLLVTRAYVDRQRAGVKEIVRWTTECGAATLGIQHSALDARLIAAARDAKVRVAAWTVNEESDIQRAINVGADVVISDRPDLAMKLAGR
jgi:glycerophosphoryl diester phosphodiesterase